ncbi:MAG: alpha/beta fold hydrolase [Candidatus Hodarchaeota archaeon]
MKSIIVDDLLEVSGSIKLAVRARIAEKTSSPTILFIHGFGCAKETFVNAFTSPSLVNFDLIAFDLPGHGQSSKSEDFTYSMRDMARCTLEILEKLGISNFHLCVHSMVGIIGIELVERTPARVRSFMNLEGNPTLDDCFFTNKIIEYSYQNFVATGRKLIEEELSRLALGDPSIISYLETFKKTSSSALYYAALDTVKISGDSKLISRFMQLKKSCYVYGERNKGKFPAEEKLLSLGVPVYYIANAGHFMIVDNPVELYKLVEKWVMARI